MYSQDENSPQSVEALVDLHDDDGSVAANNDDEPAAAAVPFEQASKEVVAVPSSVPASVLDTAGRNSMNTSFAALQVRVYGLKDWLFGRGDHNGRCLLDLRWTENKNYYLSLCIAVATAWPVNAAFRNQVVVLMR